MGAIFEFKYVLRTLPQLLLHVPSTLLLLFVCIVASLVFGLIMALLSIYKVPILSRINSFVIAFTLGMPLLTLLYLFYFGLPEVLLPLGIDIRRLHGIYFAVLSYGLHYGAVMAEHIRGAIASVGKGQSDAAFSLVMPPLTVFRRILLPQAMRVLLPNMANTYLKAMKSTSIVFTVGVVDLMSSAHSIGSYTSHMFESYLAVAIIYYVLYLGLSHVFRLAERYSLRYGN
jgi:L-cystine transport system permease protein